jgi:hypothetical protein
MVFLHLLVEQLIQEGFDFGWIRGPPMFDVDWRTQMGTELATAGRAAENMKEQMMIHKIVILAVFILENSFRSNQPAFKTQNYSKLLSLPQTGGYIQSSYPQALAAGPRPG